MRFDNDANDAPTSPSADNCSRTMKGCHARFGYSVPLPARFFPGVGLIR